MLIIIYRRHVYFVYLLCTERLSLTPAIIIAFENNSEVKWFEGNWSEYAEWRRKELGIDEDHPHKTVYRKLTR